LNFVERAQLCVAIDPILKHKLFRVKKNIEVIVGLGESLPFHSGTFDVIFVINMLDHVHNPSEVLKELRRVLHNQRILCIMVNILKTWEKALNLTIERLLGLCSGRGYQKYIIPFYGN
jgi:ubiquinone/menaquinone biosynthesis C-methylase UbiE